MDNFIKVIMDASSQESRISKRIEWVVIVIDTRSKHYDYH